MIRVSLDANSLDVPGLATQPTFGHNIAVMSGVANASQTAVPGIRGSDIAKDDPSLLPPAATYRHSEYKARSGSIASGM